MPRDHAGSRNPNYKHGLWGTQTYRIWARLYDRRGEVCKRWKWFRNFHNDMGERPVDGHLIRLSEDLPWRKDNCAWTTRKWRHQ